MNAEIQSRAEIIWGYPPEKVKANLELSGYSDDDARRLVDGYMTERTRIIRRKGWKWLILGSLGCIIGGVLFSVAFFGDTSSVAPKGQGNAAGIAAVLFIISLIKLTDGLLDVIRPEKNRESLSVPME